VQGPVFKTGVRHLWSRVGSTPISFRQHTIYPMPLPFGFTIPSKFSAPGKFTLTNIENWIFRQFELLKPWLRNWRAPLTDITPSRTQVITALLFVLFALPTCLQLALIVPLGRVADEHNHLIRAAGLLRGQILGKRATLRDANGNSYRTSGIVANPGLSAVVNARVKVTHPELERWKSIPWGKAGVYFDAANTAVYMPVFYLPAAAAIGLAKTLDLSPYTAVLMARTTNVICYLTAGILALLLARRGQTLLFAVLVMPMALSLAASCNQDGLLIAAAVLASALLTRSIHPRGRAYWIAGALLASIIAVKPPYLLLALLMLVPMSMTPRPFWDRLAHRNALSGLMLAAVPGLIWTAITFLFVSAPYHVAPFHPESLWPGNPATAFPYLDPSAQIQVFFRNPARLVTLPFVTLTTWNVTFATWDQMIGNFGNLDVPMSASVYVLWTAALASAVVNDVFFGRIPVRLQPLRLTAILGASAVLGALWLILDSEYLTWTITGKSVIDGLQGRYLLPLSLPGPVLCPACLVK